MKTVEINVIMNMEFTNHFLIKSIPNMMDAIKYAHENSDIKVNKINFIISEKDKNRFFAFDTINIKDVIKSNNLDISTNIVIKKLNNISEIFNSIRDNVSSDYVSFYSANTFWVKNHLVESINSLKISKLKWSVSNAEIRNSISMKESSILNYKKPNPLNHFVSDVIIGELVVEGSDIKNVDFRRGEVTEGSETIFYPGYALKQQIGNHAICKMSTVRYYMEFLNEEDLDYSGSDFKIEDIEDEDKDSIIFSVLINVSNSTSQHEIVRTLDSVASQKFPKKNIEIILISNYNSLSLFLASSEISKRIPNYKMLFVGNFMADEFGNLQSVIWNNGLHKSTGKYICYLDVNDGFLFTPDYLSELYLMYKNDNAKWIFSNYYDVVNYENRHSNIKSINKSDLYYSLFSHRRMDMQYYNFKIVDKHLADNNIGLLNTINYFYSQNIKGMINNKCLIEKTGM